MTLLNKQEFESIFHHNYIQVNGVHLHYVKGGSGDPVLLLHGWPQTWYEWRKVMPALAQHYTVIAPDLRGWGESSKPDTGYDGEAIAEDIRLLVQSLGNEYLRHYDDPLAIHATCEYYRNTWKTAEQIREHAQHPLTMPVMAIGGSKSLGERMIHIVQTLAPQAQGIVLDNCRHLVPEERPEELVQHLLDFLRNA